MKGVNYMKLVEVSNEYVINDREYFYNLNSPYYCPKSILANIPKLMPKIPIGEPKVVKASISSTMFCNAKECKPQPPNIIDVQNYVTLVNHSNLSPSYWSTSTNGRMNKKVRHIVEITNKDIRQMHFIEDQ